MSRANSQDLSPGVRLDGRYELLAPWAQGGMAQVWLARVQGKHGFAKLFAVKTMLPERAVDGDFRTMFLDEARIASQIRHVNVATIEDLGEESGVLYMVFEWIQGDSMGQLVSAALAAGRPLPVDIVVSIAAQAAAGLHAAHELRDESGRRLNVVHRDVSPQNILVSEAGVTKIIDFGIAKAKGRLAEATMAGMVKGKIEYMAPEQAMSQPLDRRADIFALGAVVYHLLTGRMVWEGRNDAELLFKISSDEPPPRAVEVAPALADVLDRALRPDPNARFQTAQDLQRALESCLSKPTSFDDVAAAAQSLLQASVAERRARVRVAIEQANAREAALAPPGAMRRPMASIPPEALAPLPQVIASAPEAPEQHIAAPLPVVVRPSWVLPAVIIATLLVLVVWGRILMLSWQMRHGAA